MGAVADTVEDAVDTAKELASSLFSNLFGSSSGESGGDGSNLSPSLSSVGKSVLMRQFASGGVANFTGPAWLDGSPSSPERILSPYQTKLFETMVSTLQKAATVNIPSLPFISSPDRGSADSYSFGDIVINVDKLETDEDYEEIAQKVGEVLLRQMNKGSYVGGIRYSF